jgi:ubiquitin-protein ligase
MLGFHQFQHEFKRLGKEVSDCILVEPDDTESVMIQIMGPSGTPYESGLFRILLTNLDTFPRYPPIVFFQTRIWHPLVELETGRVCPATLTQNWSAYEGVEGFLNRLQAFFFCEQLDFCINSEAAAELQRHDGTFETHASSFTKKYACD